MITAKQAAMLVEKHGGLTPVRCFKIMENCFLFVVKSDSGKQPLDPFYTVEMSSGKIAQFVPAADPGLFRSAINGPEIPFR